METLATIFLGVLTAATMQYDFRGLAERMAYISFGQYDVGKINNETLHEDGAFHLIFNEESTSQVEIPDIDHVLNGMSYVMLACRGRIIPPGNNGYVVGIAVEGPTHGTIFILADNFQKIAEIQAQKVVRMEIISLLGESASEIVTWEDHHYGTNTTRRVFNIYKVYPDQTVKKIFEHDLVDATFSPAGPQVEIYYDVDYQSLIKDKAIVVIHQKSGHKEIYTWDGLAYNGHKRAQIGPSAWITPEKECD